MEFLKPSRKVLIKGMLNLCALGSVMVFDCSEFNKPVQPIIMFSYTANDPGSGSSIDFSTYKVITLKPNWKIEPGDSPVNAKIYIKKRNENELVVDNLSDSSCNFHADVSLDNSMDSSDIGIPFDFFTNRGEKLKGYKFWSAYDKSVTLLLWELPDTLSLFFWQADFFVKGDTIRLPEQPGLWYFGQKRM